MNSYINKKNSLDTLESIREEHKNALGQYYANADKFYNELATILSVAKGKENAKPCSYFASMLATNREEYIGICSTIGAIGNTAYIDEIATRHNGKRSKGIVSKYFSNVRRDTQTVTKCYAEVDENGKVLGYIKGKRDTEYVYYTV